MQILVLYGTSEGQAKKVADSIAYTIGDRGHQVTILPGDQLPAGFSLREFDGVIIGDSVHMGRYHPYIKSFVKDNCEQLNNMPSALFTVCMGINSKREKSRDEAAGYNQHFLDETGWYPLHTATFAGAVKYTHYNFITRFIMKIITGKEGGSTDTSRDHEYTDWDSVAHFADDFIDQESRIQAVS